MTSEVIIDVQPKDISIALLEDKQLVEYQQEQRTESFSVGNIYVAKVKKLTECLLRRCRRGTRSLPALSGPGKSVLFF